MSFSVATPYKGTELYDIYKENIFVSDHRRFEASAVFSVPEYPPQYLEAMIVEAHRKFYLRPKYVLKRLGNIGSWKDLCAHVEIAINLLRGKICYKIG